MEGTASKTYPATGLALLISAWRVIQQQSGQSTWTTCDKPTVWVR
jgi:hypothetical protein